MKKREDSIDVFGRKLKIKYLKDLGEIEGNDGDYCAFKKIIQIDAELKGDKFWEALLHEFGHALFDRVSLSQGIEKQAEEIMCDVFAKCMVENFTLKFKNRG